MKKFLREHLQLMELLICILFFMAGSLMAGSLFIKASQIEKASQELQSAVEAAQQQAENLRISDEIRYKILYFNAEWQQCSESESTYKLVMEAQSKHIVIIAVYRIDIDEELIYTLKAGGRV